MRNTSKKQWRIQVIRLGIDWHVDSQPKKEGKYLLLTGLGINTYKYFTDIGWAERNYLLDDYKTSAGYIPLEDYNRGKFWAWAEIPNWMDDKYEFKRKAKLFQEQLNQIYMENEKND